MKKIILFLFIFISILPIAYTSEISEDGFFSGRISRINKPANLIRIKVDFDNIKYLNPKDKIEFWDEKNNTKKCNSIIVARSSNYLLLKVSEFNSCEKNYYFTTGSYFKFYSEDLLNNIAMGKEVVTILLKKRMAVQGQLEGKGKDISIHVERMNAINARYQILKDKLDQEWQNELHALAEDKIFVTRSYKDLERRLDEIDQKLEQYKVKDENLTLDRWSLDSHLYYKK